MTLLETLFPAPVLAIPPTPYVTVIYRTPAPERVYVRGLGHADVIGANWLHGEITDVHIRLPWGEMHVPPAVICEGDNVVVLMEERVSRARVVPIAQGPVVA